MPQLTLSAAVQLVLLLSAFPAQYLIYKWSGNTAEQRLLASAKLIRMWKEWSSSYLSISTWSEWSQQQYAKILSALGVDMEGEADSATVETMMFDNDQGYFGASKEVRSPRPPYVFLRVGEVVVDRKTHRLGVVVSWDSEMRAPAEWVFRMYKGTRSVAAKKTPHYKVLFNGPGPNHVIVAYLPQTHLKRVTGKKPNIASLDHYFIGFDGDRFVPQTWLKEIFPEDDIDDV
ncbi:uncharacterized protein si:dkey-261l7.2 [Syngnathus scovelli]|uniref:uncharacterized protein si:dkey-261l7.2 n=1 Tax=Syngnathus scovelli TaxID=161590 RepID=UPI0021107E2F|nr:uncharacterized protein si:dkey-261l7.2 isoform X1 [Syngnathus scovelli]XP_049612364.1 uncharacterized protein si:dkey-261l7.2 isoform X1 [Syngnathus scovelli]